MTNFKYLVFALREFSEMKIPYLLFQKNYNLNEKREEKYYDEIRKNCKEY